MDLIFDEGAHRPPRYYVSKVISDAGFSPQTNTDNPSRNNYVPEGPLQVGIAYTNGQLCICI